MMVGVLVLMLAMFGSVRAGSVERIGEVTVHFGRQTECRTQRATMSAARSGDAAWLAEWKLDDGSFVHAEVARDGMVEVERCACGEVGAAAVRVRVVRAQAK